MNRGERARRDLITLLVGALLLLLAVGAFWLWNERARARRAEVLAGVPEFPAPGQPARHRPLQQAARATPPPAPAPLPVRPPEPPARRDRMGAFVLAPAGTVAMVQVNALLNTPLMARLRDCAPRSFSELDKAVGQLGLDLERDIDRMAFVPGGVAISGFFEDKPLAQTLAGAASGEGGKSYRGQTIFSNARGGCMAQLGTLLVMGSGSCEPLVDRALDSSASEGQSQELYGDLFVRTDLSALRREGAVPESAAGDPLSSLIASLDGLTLRANVWDQVAVTLDGQPGGKIPVAELANMGKGALALAKTQLADDDVELQALAELAQVSVEDGKLHLDLAVPADQLLKRLKIPCEGQGAPDAGSR
jgi:hypothetical protein